MTLYFDRISRTLATLAGAALTTAVLLSAAAPVFPVA